MEKKPIRVLLVEDDVDDYVLVRHFLSNIATEDFELRWARSYEEALKAMGAEVHDVCLLDYRLGSRTGLELLQMAVGNGFKAPIIFLTGQGGYEVDLEAMKAGATDFLVKGQISGPLLERTIRYALAHKQSQELLRESERKYSTVVENSLTGIFLAQGERIIFANERLALICGYSREELIGMKVWRLVEIEERKFLDEIRKRVLRGDEIPPEYELKSVRKDGKKICLQIKSTLTEINGKPAILGNVADVTERKQAEAALRESERQLRHLSWKLLQTQEKERELTAQEIHDRIAQTLAAIKLETRQVLKRLEEEALPGVAESLEPFTAMLQEAIEETRKIYTNLRPTMLNDLGILVTLHCFCREFQEVYPETRLELKIEIEENEVPEELKIVIYRIIQEACSNLAKHAQARRGVISLRRTPSRIELAINDNGIGFTLENGFHKEDSLRGLGLAIMKQRTELSGGIFTVESTRMKGTTIRSSWPSHEA
jgi:PAS domain S-box-containing protein